MSRKMIFILVCALIFSMASCRPASTTTEVVPTTVVATIPPTVEAVETVTDPCADQLPTVAEVEALIANGGTEVASGAPTTEVDPVCAKFDPMVSPAELSTNGVTFESLTLEQMGNYQLSEGQTFAYIQLKNESLDVDSDGTVDNVLVYSLSVFSNASVADYSATIADALNLFVVTGSSAETTQSQAIENMNGWCMTKIEGINGICFH